MKKQQQEPMNTLEPFCLNTACLARGKMGEGNIRIHDQTQEDWHGIEVRAHAEVFSEGGQLISSDVSPEVTRLMPKRLIIWDISGCLLPNSEHNVE